jgi:hypothetical protein
MDGAGDDHLGWTLDGMAAAALGAAAGTCLLLLGWPQAGVGAAASLGLVALAGLRLIKPEPRRFRLPAFDLPEPESTPATEELLLTELAGPEPLLLDDPLEEAAPDSRVVQLFAARPLPTPGELQQRIAAHLSTVRAPAEGGALQTLDVDASAALRQSLSELRRSLA